MRNKSTQVVYDLVKADKRVLAVTADNGNEIYDRIKKEFPAQYIDFGISESNMIAASAGMAAKGKIPFLYAVTNFMAMRAYEFIRNMVCVTNLNVKFIGRSASMVTGTYGMTHQGTEDLALLRTLPNLITITPATPIEAREATRWAYEYDGPVYIRIEAANEPELFDESFSFSPYNGTMVREGNDIAVISMGSVINEVINAANLLSSKDISVCIINMPVVKPIDKKIIVEVAKRTGRIITVEEHSVFGGLGSAVAEVIAEEKLNVVFERMGLASYALGCGSREVMRKINNLDSVSIENKVIQLC